MSREVRRYYDLVHRTDRCENGACDVKMRTRNDLGRWACDLDQHPEPTSVADVGCEFVTLLSRRAGLTI